MNLVLIVFLVAFSFSCYAQPERARVFKTVEYSNGRFYRETYSTVRDSSKNIDIYFFNRNFYLPYHLPKVFIDRKRKKQTVAIWRDPKGKKDFNQNWENTYTYDEFGRVVNFTYSGCFICSSFAYKYTVSYDSTGKITKIHNNINSKDSFEFYYNKKGDIIKLNQYSANALEKEILFVY